MNSASFQTNLMNLHSNMVSFAYMLTGNREDAYDLTQDATLKALDNQDMYVEDTNFKGWVFAIMRNLFINNYRKASKTATIVDTTDNLYFLNVSQDSGLMAPEGSYAAQDIIEAIRHLIDDYRIPFTMYVSGYKYHEIAEQLNLPLGTVKSRIFFVRKRLQEQLVDYGY